MGRGVLLINLILFIGSMSASYYFYLASAQLDSQNRELQAKVQDLTERLNKTQAQLSAELKGKQQEVQLEATTLAGLKAKFQEQRDKAESLRQKLEDAKASLKDRNNLSIRERIQKQKALLDDLRQELQRAQKQQSAVSSQAQYASQTNKQQANADLAQINQQITDQQTQINATNQAIAPLKGKKDFTSQQQLRQYIDVLAQQKDAMTRLRQQKSTLQQGWSSAQSDVQTQAQSQLGSIKATIAKLQSTIQAEQVRLSELEKSMDSSNKDVQAMQAQVNLLSNQYQIEKAKADAAAQQVEIEQQQISQKK